MTVLPIEVEPIVESFNEQINRLVAARESLLNIYKPLIGVDLRSLLGQSNYELWTDLIATEIQEVQSHLTDISQDISNLT